LELEINDSDDVGSSDDSFSLDVELLLPLSELLSLLLVLLFSDLEESEFSRSEDELVESE
jgi:hypothetical protein